MIRAYGLLPGCLALAACTARDAAVPDTAAPSATVNAPALDTTTGLYKQQSMMTAFIDATPVDAFDSDTLTWLARADTCAMIIRATGPTSRAHPSGDWWFLASDRGTSMGPGHSVDVSASPDFRHIAYTATSVIPSDTGAWAAEVGAGSQMIDDMRRAAERRPDGSVAVTYAVVPTADDCMGDECPLPLVSPVHGGARIGWTADSRYLLVAAAQDSSRWTAIDPKTLKPVEVDGLAPHAPRWGKFVIDASALRAPMPEIRAGGVRFTSRSDSIFMDGPNRDGVMTTRFVGPGIPIVASRHGLILTAVRREKGRWRGVVYIIRASSHRVQLACNAD